MFMPFTVSQGLMVHFMIASLILWLGYSQLMIKQSLSLSTAYCQLQGALELRLVGRGNAVEDCELYVTHLYICIKINSVFLVGEDLSVFFPK